jgi:hypothetical protein
MNSIIIFLTQLFIFSSIFINTVDSLLGDSNSNYDNKPPDELAAVVHKNVYYQNHSNGVIEQASIIRQIRRAIRRRVSKSPKQFFNHEEPHIKDWQKKLNDLEDLEQRANLVANHMADKYPSRLAGDDALDRTNDVDYKNLLKPTASPDYDGPKLTGTNMRIKAMRENERRRTTEEKIKRVASLAPLNATKGKKFISAGDDVIPS